MVDECNVRMVPVRTIRLETKSCRILPLTHGTKYDVT